MGVHSSWACHCEYTGRRQMAGLTIAAVVWIISMMVIRVAGCVRIVRGKV